MSVRGLLRGKMKIQREAKGGCEGITDGRMLLYASDVCTCGRGGLGLREG